MQFIITTLRILPSLWCLVWFSWLFVYFTPLKNTLNHILDCRDFVEYGPPNLSVLLSTLSLCLDRDDEVSLFAEHPSAPLLLQLGNWFPRGLKRKALESALRKAELISSWRRMPSRHYMRIPGLQDHVRTRCPLTKSCAVYKGFYSYSCHLIIVQQQTKWRV